MLFNTTQSNKTTDNLVVLISTFQSMSRDEETVGCSVQESPSWCIAKTIAIK